MRDKTFCLLILSIFSVSFALDYASDNKLFVVVTASYNNARWYERNISSVFSQNYKNYHLIYVDDCSTDGTADLVQCWAHEHGVTDRITLIRNTERLGAMANQFRAIHLVPDGAVICILDGDDWFAGPNVFTHLNKLYADSNVWITHGQFVTFPEGHRGWSREIPKKFVDSNGFRDYVHNLTHLRTFYAGLFKKIAPEDLMFEGKFWRMCADNAAMFPMAEMAREGHIKFNPEVLLIWNGANSLNDHKVVRGLQREIDLRIRKMRRYDKIGTPIADGQEVTVNQIKRNVEEAKSKGEVAC